MCLSMRARTVTDGYSRLQHNDERTKYTLLLDIKPLTMIPEHIVCLLDKEPVIFQPTSWLCKPSAVVAQPRPDAQWLSPWEEASLHC